MYSETSQSKIITVRTFPDPPPPFSWGIHIPLPLSFHPTFMKDLQCAQTNEKLTIRFLFFELSCKFIENWGDMSAKMTKNEHHSRNTILKKLKMIYLPSQPIPDLSCKFEHFTFFFFFNFCSKMFEHF